MSTPLALIWELIAKDKASPAFNRVASSAERAAGATSTASKKIGGATAVMGRAGSKLTKGLTLPLVGLAVVATAQAAHFQTSLNTIQVATDRTNAEMAAGSKGLLTIAKATGTTLGSLTDSFYVASKSGMSVAKSLNVTRAAAQGAKAEGADLGTVTDALTSIMASYGKSLKNPVVAMNEIIRGSGLAKTTIQDFAGSLANVVPIASALHISFAQVAGAIATMTQHGETAQRATDNLSNLITNLAGQNNVAAAALGQLGINTVNLSRNLGKRGLTGSLNLVLDAIAKHSKAGLVVTDAFKHSATASASLRQELAAMPPVLQKNAQAFDAGKISYKDFYAFAKSLGGQQYQLAKGFIATEGTAKGFSSQLKSGNSTVSTLARTLQKALGGVTGMRTALMLSGASAKTFASDTKQVQKAALEAGSDVLGWGKTQNTLAVKMDKAKASLQVFAVEIGSKLLPAASRVVDKLSSVVHWFENLSGTQQKVAAWGIGVLVALGPVLSMGAKLATVGRGISSFVVGAGNQFAKLGTSATGMSAKATTAVKGFTAAIGGAAVGLAIGSLTRNMSAGGKAIGAFAATATGAAIGFGVGGPLGAAIGGAAGLVTDLASAFSGTGDAAKAAAAEAEAAMQREQSAAEDLFQTLKQTRGLFVPQARNVVFDQLRQSGLLDKFTKNGANPEQLINIALGKNVKHSAGFDRALAHLSTADKGKFTEIQRSGALAENDYELYRQQQHKTTVSSKLLAGGLKNLNKELVKNADVNEKATAGQAGTFAGSIRNREVLKENVQQLQRQYLAQVKSGQSAFLAEQAYRNNIAALKAQAVSLGLNAGAVETLVNRFARVPGKVQTQIDVLTDKAIAALGSLQQKISGIVNGYHQVTMTVVESNGIAHGNTTGGKHSKINRARGGFVFGRGTATSDSISAKLSNGEFVVRAAMAKHFAPVLESINNGTFGFSRGGRVGSKMPAPKFSSAGDGRRGGGTRTVRVVVDMDDHGKWQQVVRDIVLDDSDLDATIGRMR